MRVLITGMGGELGTLVANRLEDDPAVEAILGIDIDPPRRRVQRADFARIDPRDRRKIVRAVRAFEPTAVVHLGVYEPHARSGPGLARDLTRGATVNVLGATLDCAGLDRIVVRSGIEVYGRGRGAATRPDESVLPQPTSPFGRSLLETEHTAIEVGAAADVPVTAVRCAPIVGPHMASPLGRYLRLPVVAVAALSDEPFSLLHQHDAADALVRAVQCGFDGPVNVVGDGAVTPVQAVRLGGRLVLPVAGPQWWLAQIGAELLGAPLAAHVRELLVRGRVADGGQARSILGIEPRRSTPDVVRELHDWAEVTYLRPGSEKAA